MSGSEANNEIVRRYQESINDRDWDALDSVLAEDVATPLMLPGFPSGREGAKAMAPASLAPWPTSDANRSAHRRGRSGGHRRDEDRDGMKAGSGLPGTGRPFTMVGAYIVRIANGLIVEHAGVEDVLAMIAQVTGGGSPPVQPFRAYLQYLYMCMQVPIP